MPPLSHLVALLVRSVSIQSESSICNANNEPRGRLATRQTSAHRRKMRKDVKATAGSIITSRRDYAVDYVQDERASA
uniref:Putative secreted protein n=1 Tax=Anopheles darlingi TaxID=43151 RepID=A0A2M4DI91_ANODA